MLKPKHKVIKPIRVTVQEKINDLLDMLKQNDIESYRGDVAGVDIIAIVPVTREVKTMLGSIFSKTEIVSSEILAKVYYINLMKNEDLESNRDHYKIIKDTWLKKGIYFLRHFDAKFILDQVKNSV